MHTSVFLEFLKISLIPIVPLSCVCLFLLTQNQFPAKKRLLISAPSILFILMMLTATTIGSSMGYGTPGRKSLETIPFALFLMGALSMLFALFYVRTWLNLTQIVSMFFGLVGFYIIAVLILGEGM